MNSCIVLTAFLRLAHVTRLLSKSVSSVKCSFIRKTLNSVNIVFFSLSFQCIHKDVAARNIRLGNKSVAKVTNIGCSRVTYEDISAVSLK